VHICAIITNTIYPINPGRAENYGILTKPVALAACLYGISRAHLKPLTFSTREL